MAKGKSKLDAMRLGAGANVAESMGVGVRRADPAPSTTPAAADPWDGVERLPGALLVPLDRITRDPDQPREIFSESELQELVESIEARGVLQPIRVRWDDELHKYTIISGERRCRAARMAGLAEIPCVLREGELSAVDLLIDQITENMIRDDLRPIEQARAFRKILDRTGWSARQLAMELHLDKEKVHRALKLLELPEDIQRDVEAGAIPPSTAVEVAKAPPEERKVLAERVKAEGLTRDATAIEARSATARATGTPRAARRRVQVQVDEVTIAINAPPDCPIDLLEAMADAARQAYLAAQSRRSDAA